MACHTCSFTVGSAEQTAQRAVALGALLRPGDTILLDGVVGAGKTHFARHLIQSLLDVAEDVPSPTFTLVQTYDTRSGSLWHADLYRLSSVFEIEELGLTEAFETEICLIEWPDRLAQLTPNDALTIRFAQGAPENSRTLTLDWTDPKWEAVVLSWKAS
ncbi:tRNA (adenosine(37)-N6)-threonylcarbamoyltransferase complex ATPase subunit type 1 TsaE [Roseobacter litoralis]|uniref:tRNA (adenosine(37)-N6)-threonylcarbamoyltransferase complex ATPase subunit type 1 TsaE n=1 Tax=Roseobacter litoralis TaxID=42443 RepID=UPI00249441A8|nr:tRNA (adenosine(37)-N6)-threonylcarbamoyltransferase complex ATPase subunit type 1 TsaE [Roseobacter litoralis]